VTSWAFFPDKTITTEEVCFSFCCSGLVRHHGDEAMLSPGLYVMSSCCRDSRGRFVGMPCTTICTMGVSWWREIAPGIVDKCYPTLAYRLVARRLAIRVKDTFGTSLVPEERESWVDRMGVEARAFFRSSLSSKCVLRRTEPSSLTSRRRGRPRGVVFVCCLLV
jgi:hypothetical protein